MLVVLIQLESLYDPESSNSIDYNMMMTILDIPIKNNNQ